MTKTLRLTVAVLLLAVSLAPKPAAALDDARYGQSVDAAIKTFIIPGYHALAFAADRQSAAMGTLCAAPSNDAVTKARQAFSGLVGAFARVEMLRIGPVRDHNRYERLFFWPDRKGRGLKQVLDLIRTQDPGALNAADLRKKSVAVQGLLALEYVLYGAGHKDLLTPSAFRCGYGEAISGAMSLTAAKIESAWKGKDGFGAFMRNAGPDNAVFHTHLEAFTALLEGMAELVELDRDIKLYSNILDSADKARPKRLPYWRSNLTLRSIGDSVRALGALHDAMGIDAMLPEDKKADAGELRSGVDEALKTIAMIDAMPGGFVDKAHDPKTHADLLSIITPLSKVMKVLSENYPAELGFTLGFNSLDGD